MTLEATDREAPNRSGMTMLVAAIAGALAGMAAAMMMEKRIARRSRSSGPTPLNVGPGITAFDDHSTAEHAAGGGHVTPGAPPAGGGHSGGSPGGGHGGSSGGGHGGSSGGGSGAGGGH